jgi:2-polyprenyl-3-methyl-5-hydroxy-6-metoxy-1,4-benzoquinol methylase
MIPKITKEDFSKEIGCLYKTRPFVMKSEVYSSFYDALLRYTECKCPIKKIPEEIKQALVKKEELYTFYVMFSKQLTEYHYILITILKLNSILKFKSKIKVLDFGCFMGLFVGFMQDSGFDNTYGVDISQEFIEIGKSFNINNLYTSDYNDFNPNTKFDIIVSSVMIHEDFDHKTNIEEHNRFIKKCNSIINNDGIIILKSRPHEYNEEIIEIFKKNNYNILNSKLNHDNFFVVQKV